MPKRSPKKPLWKRDIILIPLLCIGGLTAGVLFGFLQDVVALLTLHLH